MNRFHLRPIFLFEADWPFFLRGHSIAVNGDAGSSVLVWKIALVDRHSCTRRRQCNHGGRTTFAIFPTTSRTFGLSSLPGLTQYLQPRRRNGEYSGVFPVIKVLPEASAVSASMVSPMG
jgi:hypothetical protein